MRFRLGVTNSEEGGTQKRYAGSRCQTVKYFFVLTTLLLNKLFETHNFHFVAGSCLFVFVIVIVNNNNNNDKNLKISELPKNEKRRAQKVGH